MVNLHAWYIELYNKHSSTQKEIKCFLRPDLKVWLTSWDVIEISNSFHKIQCAYGYCICDKLDNAWKENNF